MRAKVAQFARDMMMNYERFSLFRSLILARIQSEQSRVCMSLVVVVVLSSIEMVEAAAKLAYAIWFPAQAPISSSQLGQLAAFIIAARWPLGACPLKRSCRLLSAPIDF